jgi:hypothetical protein
MVATLVERGSEPTRNPPLAWRNLTTGIESGQARSTGDEPANVALPWYDEDRERLPVARGIAWVLIVFALTALTFSLLLRTD